jgi:O-succinylbenzoic acid--CoA ligase
LPSYGLTECSSQVATAEYGSWNLVKYPLLHPLEHVQLAVNEEGYLRIKSNALLTAYFESHDLEVFSLRDPKNDGWFTSEDQAEFENKLIKKVCRGGNFIKIGGESVDMLRLEKILEEKKLAVQCSIDMALIALEDERLGFRIHLFATSSLNIEKVVEYYQQCVFPFERIHQIHIVKEIPRSPLNKVLHGKLKVIPVEAQ